MISITWDDSHLDEQLSSAMNAVTTHFEQAAPAWDQRPISQQLGAVAAHVLRHVPFKKHDHVLDFGAGTGLLATAIAPHVARVTALDTSAAMLQMLDEKRAVNVTTLQHDMLASWSEHQCGHHAVVSCMAMHHVADTAALMQVFARTLCPGGHIALVDLYEEDGSFHGDNAAMGVHHSGFVPDVLHKQAEQAGLTHIQFREILHVQHRNGRAYPLFLMTGSKP